MAKSRKKDITPAGVSEIPVIESRFGDDQLSDSEKKTLGKHLKKERIKREKASKASKASKQKEITLNDLNESIDRDIMNSPEMIKAREDRLAEQSQRKIELAPIDKGSFLDLTTQKFTIDLKANRINKFDQQWYQVLDPIQGMVDLRSITTILKMAHPMDSGLIKFFKREGKNADIIRDEAGQVGSKVHKLIEMTLLGNPVTFENEIGNRICTLEEYEIYLMWCRWYQDQKKADPEFKILFVEQIVYSVDEKIAGTVDAICQTKKGLRIKDWKTGGIYNGDIQVSKYVDIVNRMEFYGKIIGADIVQLGGDLNKKGYRETCLDDEIDHNIKRFNIDLQSFDINFPKFAPKYKSYPNSITLEMLDSGESVFLDEQKADEEKS